MKKSSNKISQFFQKLKLRNLPAPRRPCPPRGPLAPRRYTSLTPSSTTARGHHHHRQGLQTLSYRLWYGITLAAPSGTCPPGPCQ
jgi:hypothetical protein